MDELKICRLCKQPVTVNHAYYDVFEGMHWLCFHIVFEHNGDPDLACGDPSCPWYHLDVYKRKLRELGVDPENVFDEAIKRDFHL